MVRICKAGGFMRVDYYILYIPESLYLDTDMCNGLENYTVYGESLAIRNPRLAALAIL